MINIKARNRILTLYKEGSDSYEKLKKEECKQLLYAIRSYIISDNKEWSNAVGQFLCYGTWTFARFIGNRPQIVDDDMYNTFCEFLSTLQKLDGKFYGRTYFFHLEKVKWQIFMECSLLPYDEEMEAFLSKCEEELDKLILPEGPNVEKMKMIREEVIALINDIRNENIKTKIHTTLPFKITNTDSTIILKVKGVNINARICNHSQGSSLPGISIAEGATMTTSGPSKWTTTTCELDIEASCLMDGLEVRQNVTLQKREDNRYWITVYDFTYQIISTIWMHFQQHEDMPSVWPPLPNDIHYIEYHVTGSREYDYEFSTNPALVYHVTPLKKGAQYYEINEDLPNWSNYAFQFAKVYATSGQLKESIFWLNVSVEAMVEEFIQKIAKNKEMLAELEKDEYKFDKAEEILAQQYPEMKGKVKWPNTVIHASVFVKLKRAVKISNISDLQKDILKKYSQIHSKRNALFHGVCIDVLVEDVEKAFNAYAWLKEKLLN